MTAISRRNAIVMSGQTLVGVVAASGLHTRAVSANEPRVGWERFLELCHELSESQYAEFWDQDAYTAEIQRTVRRLRLDDPKIAEYSERYRNANSDLPTDFPSSFPPGFPQILPAYYERQFMVSLLEFEPGEEIPLHDHPGMTGVVFCTIGHATVDHYDKIEETAESGNLLLRHERHLEMTAGDSAALTIERGNIHCLKAREFTRMIDVFTPPYDNDRLARSRYYAMDSSPYLGRKGIFEAWSSVDPV